MSETFRIGEPSYDAATGVARFPYALGELHFTETLTVPRRGGDMRMLLASDAFGQLLDLPPSCSGSAISSSRRHCVSRPMPHDARSAPSRRCVLEWAAANFTPATSSTASARSRSRHLSTRRKGRPSPLLKDRALLPIGGGKDSLVSVELLEAAGLDYSPFAVNPKGPILSSVGKVGKTPLYVTRTLDPEMIRLGKEPGYLNGHVPSTAINSMIAALRALLYSYNRIVL